jgi:hypothetical protein
MEFNSLSTKEVEKNNYILKVKELFRILWGIYQSIGKEFSIY